MTDEGKRKIVLKKAASVKPESDVDSADRVADASDPVETSRRQWEEAKREAQRTLRQGLIISKTGKHKFAKGNKFGKGWSKTHSVQRAFQKAFFSAVTDEDIRDIAMACVRSAKKGNLYAAREIFDRCLGKPDDTMVVKRLKELEDMYLNGGSLPPAPIPIRRAETA